MKISKSDIDQLYSLAAFSPDSKESEDLANKLESVLSYMQQLNQIDTDQVTPMNYVHGEHNVVREDVVEQSLSTDLVLSKAPAADEDYFLVPKVIETS